MSGEYHTGLVGQARAMAGILSVLARESESEFLSDVYSALFNHLDAPDGGDMDLALRELRAKKVALVATEQPIDTSTAAGKAFLDMLGVFAEFETNLRHERQMEGIAKAKARGVYKGRKPSVDVDRVRALQAEGLGPTAIAIEMGVSRSTIWRVLRDHPMQAGSKKIL